MTLPGLKLMPMSNWRWRLRRALLYPDGVGQPARRSLPMRATLPLYNLLYASLPRRRSRADCRTEIALIPRRKLLYVAVPKAASRSLLYYLSAPPGQNAVGPAVIKQQPPADLLRARPELADYFKFTVVRNPWSRVFSAYRQKIQTDDPLITARLLKGRQGLAPNMPFADFVEWLGSEEGADAKADKHWLSQYRILGLAGPEPVRYDFIGKLERLPDDLDTLSARLGVSLAGVGHLLYSGAAESYRAAYTDRTAELVAQRYAQDIARFGYRFDGDESDGDESGATKDGVCTKRPS